MGAGPIAETIMFMMLFVSLVASGIVFLCFASRCVLVVVQETGLGQDEVTWPNEPYVDWLAHAVLFVELLGIWIAPAALAARMLRHTWLTDQGFLRVLVLVGPGLWLFFPVGLLSSLSASSRWIPFRWTIFYQFLRITPSAVGFYLLTALVLGAAAVPWYYTLIGGHTALLPVAAIVSATAILIYARLLGRLAWLIQRLPSPRSGATASKAPKRPVVRTEGRKAPKSGGKKKRKRGLDVQDPWAIPEEERSRHQAKRFPWAEEPTPPPKARSPYRPPNPEEIEGYGIAAEKPFPPDTPPEKPARHPMYTPPEEYEPIDVQSSAPVTPPREDEDSGLFAEQVRQRLAERTRAELPPPTHPFFSGVYTFPWYANSLPNWIALSLGALLIGGIVKGLIYFGGIIFGW
jgi:hypothetical protein